MFHQLLDHRWYLSQNEGRNVPLAEALTSYIDTVLRHRRDEVTVVAPVTGVDHAADRRGRRGRGGLAIEGMKPASRRWARIGRRPRGIRSSRSSVWVVALGIAVATALLGVTGEDLFDRLGSDGASCVDGESDARRRPAGRRRRATSR